ncbi:MAG: TonB family protein [Opitutaceae bacterium]|jgi:colicin import membrane protein
MTAQSPSAYLLSATVHAAAVALLLTVAWVVQQQVREPAKVMEVVAGAGDNWAATEAPALGSPTGSEEVKVPNIPVPMPKISEPEPAPAMTATPEPVKPAPIEQAPPIEKAAPEKAPPAAVKPSPLDTKKTTFAQDVKRISDKRYKRLVDKFHKEQAAAEAADRKRMTKEEFDKAYAYGKAGTAGGGKIKRVDAKGIAGGVVGGSTANTKGGAGGRALSVTEQNLFDQYFAYFKQRFKAVHEPPPGVGDQLSASVEFMVAADGSISQAHITQSSGNPEFDRSIIDAFRRMKSIGARPDGRSDMVELIVDSKEED